MEQLQFITQSFTLNFSKHETDLKVTKKIRSVMDTTWNQYVISVQAKAYCSQASILKKIYFFRKLSQKV